MVLRSSIVYHTATHVAGERLHGDAEREILLLSLPWNGKPPQSSYTHRRGNPPINYEIQLDTCFADLKKSNPDIPRVTGAFNIMKSSSLIRIYDRR